VESRCPELYDALRFSSERMRTARNFTPPAITQFYVPPIPRYPASEGGLVGIITD